MFENKKLHVQIKLLKTLCLRRLELFNRANKEKLKYKRKLEKLKLNKPIKLSNKEKQLFGALLYTSGQNHDKIFEIKDLRQTSLYRTMYQLTEKGYMKRKSKGKYIINI